MSPLNYRLLRSRPEALLPSIILLTEFLLLQREKRLQVDFRRIEV